MSQPSVQNSLPQTPIQLALGRLMEFPDALSPMLVKELRQGLRARSFIYAFLALHFLLVLITLVTFGNPTKEAPTGLFWFIITTILVLILPLRGFNGLSTELRLNTLDTLVLTRLSAVRIVTGKWCAIAAQIFLLGVSIGPYILARYFAGGVNLPRECLFIAFLLMAGLVLTAWCICFSWVRYFLLRGVICLGAALFFWWTALHAQSFLTEDRLAPLAGMEGGGFVLALMLLFCSGGFLIMYLLDLGAARIAPTAENRTTARRVMGLAASVVLVAACLWSGGRDFGLAHTLMQGLLVLTACDAANEAPNHLSSVHRPFLKLGWWGRMAGRIFYPGWHSGILYFFIMAGALAACCYFSQSWGGNSDESKVRILRGHELTGLLLFCLLVTRLWQLNKTGNSTGVFAALFLIVGVLQFFVAEVNASAGGRGYAFSLVVLPGLGSSLKPGAMGGSLTLAPPVPPGVENLHALSWGLLGSYALILALIATAEFRKTRAAERAVRQESMEPGGSL